jgi:hypothetical protein
VSSTCAVTLPVAVMLSSCVSTQTVASRARLVNGRVVAATQPTRVVRANPEVTVAEPVLIHGAAGTAIVVSVRNDSSRVLTDLPISVGIRTRAGREVWINGSANLDYFDSHLAAIGARATTTWVFTTSGRVPAGRPFARVGVPSGHPSLVATLPRIEVAADGTAGVSVTNRSAIPQYDLPVYVVAVRNGHDVAAGRVTVTHLATNGSTTKRVTLFGPDAGATLRLIAVPTVFS